MPEDQLPRSKAAQLEEKVNELEKSLKQVEKFAKDLIAALQQAEKDNKNLFLLPQGSYYGITID